MSTKIGVSRLVALAILLATSSVARADWIFIFDTDFTDQASNPDSPSLPGGDPANQGTSTPNAVAFWLQDLLNLATTPVLLASADEFSGGTISGIPSGASYLTLHYGRLPYFPVRNVTAAFSCTSNCGSFTGYPTQGLSNYRIFGSDSSSVPEPATLALFGAGLLGLGLSRRRRRRA